MDLHDLEIGGSTVKPYTNINGYIMKISWDITWYDITNNTAIWVYLDEAENGVDQLNMFFV